MEPYQIETYQPHLAEKWNQFLTRAKNATFLFNRGFMDYHSARFTDGSLVIYQGDKIKGVLPANLAGNALYSQQGLSYGGLVVAANLKFNAVATMFQALLKHLHNKGIDSLVIKVLPEIYTSIPAQESNYLLHLCEAELLKSELSSTIANPAELKIQSNRLEGVKKAQKQGLRIKKETDFTGFWNHILIPNLEVRHEAKPVHSLEEISLLASRFPNNIHLYNVYHQDKLVGGSCLFETKTTIHAQYISANQDKQQLGTLDFLFAHLIQKEFAHKKYFDFGISTVDGGKELNQGLLYWKECFGARSTLNTTYKLKTANYNALTPFIT